MNHFVTRNGELSSFIAGLDAATARNVIQCLSELSKTGRKSVSYTWLKLCSQKIYFLGTVIFSIHQPRYSIFKLFDTVHLMCQGKSVYHGSAQDMLSHFATQGYYCEAHDNPADFALDVLIDASQKSEDLEKINQAYWKSLMYQDITVPARTTT